MNYRWFKTAGAVLIAGSIGSAGVGVAYADVQPGDTITKDNADKAKDVLTPAMQWFVSKGMRIKVIPYKKVELPKLYKEATEKYSGQVKLSADGREIFNYVAGLPFPKIDPNDPMV